MPCIAIVRPLLALTLALPFAALAGNSPATSNAGITAAPVITIPAKPITSSAQWDAYVRDTPAANSPLSWLTPGGRQRFLASLVFGEHGVGGFSLDDLEYDLTREQAYTLLRLIGAESYAINMDARSAPRPASDASEPDTLDSPYDRLIAASEQNNDKALIRSYAEGFAPFQNDARRRRLDDRDVELLFRAASQLFYRAMQPTYLTDMRQDFAELERRHAADRPSISDLYDALLRAHQTEQARALLASHPLIERKPPPIMRTARNIRKGQPSLWIADANRRELVRLRFNIHAPSQVVVLGSTGCHFSANAARALEADSLLRDIFRDYAQWVAPSADLTAFDAVRTWNRTYPDMRFGIAYDNAALPMVKRFDTPTFYFLDHGTVVDTVVGWPESGNLDAIRRGLREINLLR
jgi:hypothetical protein